MRAESAAGPEPGAAPESSRVSIEGAGWACTVPGTFDERMPPRVRRFSWRHPRVLWHSRNEVVAGVFGDPSDAARRGWLAALRERAGAGAGLDFMVRREQEQFSFLVMGDTGEGDRSQYAVVPALLAAGGDTDFMVLASDVIYPAGGAGDYADKFFRPYADYPAPIFAIPGNHDWYDGLRGFMRVFCEVTGDPAARPWRGPFAPLARLLWRAPDEIDEAALTRARQQYRSRPEQQARQPGPYWAIDAPALRIIGIDTGITGGIDRDQADWLRRVSQGPKPKVLVTGKPLYVDDQRRPGRIEGAENASVDDIVRDPAHNYVAAIGGDIHNYQRYPVAVRDRVIHYIVSGGGGAFMHATHTIRKTRLVDEHDLRLYPLRGDSLSRYSKLYGRWLRASRFFALDPDEAAAVVAQRLDMPITRDDAAPVRPGPRARMVASLLGVPRRQRSRPGFLRLPVHRLPQRFRSEFADWDDPPFFKSFLRLDVTESALVIRCFAVTGCGDQEFDPPCEDEITIPLR